MYFDTDGLPAMDTYRKYGYRKKYDADGHVGAVICPDSSRNIMNNSDHYATIKKTYYADSKLHTEKTYDQDNISARLKNVQYVQLYINNKPLCIDKDSNKYSLLLYYVKIFNNMTVVIPYAALA